MSGGEAKEERLLKDIFNSVRKGMALTDASGRILLENCSFHNLWGVTDAAGLREKASLVKTPKKFLKKLLSLTKSAAPANFEVSLKDGRRIEIRSEPFNGDMRLWQIEDVSGRVKALDALKSSNRKAIRLEALVRELDEKERERLGREIHDMIGQTLSVLSLRCEVLKNRLVVSGSEYALDATSLLDGIKLLMTQTRSLARQLFPIAVETRGLEDSLSELAGSLRVSLGIDCSCSFKGCEHLKKLDAEHKINLLRISQEAVCNAVKHGSARKIRISLSLSSKSGSLMVSNDGAEFPDGEQGDGIGLAIMKSRAKILGGALSIAKKSSGDVQLKCVFPLEKPKQKGTL